MTGDQASDPRFSAATVRAAYDAVADDYDRAFGDDLDRLPLDRAMLDAAVNRIATRGLVLDVGCGPAPAGRYLRARGVAVIGADLSAGMLAVARQREPLLPLVEADMRRLPLRANSFAGVISYYAIQHLPRDDVSTALKDMASILQPGGLVLLAAHLGDETRYLDEFLGHRVHPVGGNLYQRRELLDVLAYAGFLVEIEEQRKPLPHEADTQRIYLLGHRTAT
jgi:ubiquinone/menaquinone biosynthesis C-methylase UbiE